MVFVYILESLTDRGYYIGISKDLNMRLKLHNRGHVRSTKSRRPFKLVYEESYINYVCARLREKQIKSYKGGDSFKRLLGK